ncbi:MAG: hypothetical protein ABJF10_02555 [Chthoniobacter sp.]|uniref:hypothetical protein n=1 Tax=Chthoniobacter sp. TaxID=2510640 RepID=UPI0032A290ED
MKKNSASTMLAVLAMLSMLSACVIASLNYTATVSRNVVASNAQRRATEVGDGALDYAFAYWRELCKESPNTLRPTADFAAIPLPTSTLFPTISGFTANRGANPGTGTPYTIANYVVQAVDPQMNALASSTTTPPVGTGMQTGTNTAYYLASADVTIPAFASRMLTMKMRRVFTKELKSPWEYAIFYNDLLEIHPGATQTIAGWVHTNGSLYTAHNTLTFASKVDYGNDWGIAFAPGDNDHSETPASPNYPSNLPPARGQIQLPFGMDPTQVFTNSTSNNSGYHELIEPPTSGTPDPIANARYYNQADIRILVDASNTVTMTNNAGTTLNSSSTGTNLALYNTFTSALKTNDSLQDNREAATMRIVTLDMSKVTAALTGAGALVGTGFKGVVYVADTSGSSTVKRGVRLKNGAKMPAGGLTVVSMNPVYIQGDYNTGRTVNGSGTVTAETPTNTANNGTGSNIVSGYLEQPCAVLGDAVNILSNAWTDASSSGSLSGRIASPTTVNAAIVSGIVPTGTASSGANSYSGGAENFPRFLEDWGSKTFTYYGSMVELFKSQQNTGYWGNANVYGPPNRNWNFDTLFYTQPPPGTLLIVTYSKARWYVQ